MITLSRSTAKCAAGTLMLAFGSMVPASAASWQEVVPLPESNGGFVCAEVQGAVVVLGGTNWEGGQKNWLRVVHRLDPDTLRWSSLPLLARPVAYAVADVADGVLLVAGGSTGTGLFPGLIRVDGRQAVVREDIGIAVPAVLSAGGIFGDEFVVAGGTDDAANIKGLSRAVFAWNHRTGAQRKLPDYPGPGFGIAASAVAGGELLVFGGATWNETTQGVSNLSAAYGFSPRRNAWRQLRPLPYAVRGITALALDDNRIYLAGGYGGPAGEFLDRAFIYQAKEDRYVPALPLPYRASVGLVKCGGFVYCLGGEDRMKHRSSAVFRIRIAELVVP